MILMQRLVLDLVNGVLVVSPYGPSEENENGEQLLDFCAGHNLIVSHTWFQHKPIHRLTWYRNGD